MAGTVDPAGFLAGAVLATLVSGTAFAVAFVSLCSELVPARTRTEYLWTTAVATGLLALPCTLGLPTMAPLAWLLTLVFPLVLTRPRGRRLPFLLLVVPAVVLAWLSFVCAMAFSIFVGPSGVVAVCSLALTAPAWVAMRRGHEGLAVVILATVIALALGLSTTLTRW
jgi:hypothetical protein